jgi:homoserine kinase
MKSGIKVVAPASVSNLACGFDALGVAIQVAVDEIIGKWVDTPGIKITGITGAKKDIPLDPEKNIAGITAHSLLNFLGEEGRGLELRIHKHVPGGSGLGSSASSATAAAVVVNELLNRPLEKRDLIRFALDGESHASGSRHGDNVVPAMIGGLVLIRDIDSYDYHRVYTPPGLYFAIVLPDFPISTKTARDLLQPTVPLKDMVKQSANLGSLIIGMQQGDFELISRSMQDHVIEHQRKHLIPHFDEIKETSLKMGALACTISGAGPAIFALCNERSIAEDIAIEMQRVFEKNKIHSKHYAAGINHEGTMLM